MASRSFASYHQRAQDHCNPLVQQLFRIAEAKATNIIVSADLTTTDEILELADQLGPYIAVFKTHADIISDFGPRTIQGLKLLSLKHNFLIFEDRKFVDIGHTVQKQYHGGILRISEWAHFVNASILAGGGIIEALRQTANSTELQELRLGNRGLLILAEMTTKGSLATGNYTQKSINVARHFKDFVVGFVATSRLNERAGQAPPKSEDFVVFTTGINHSSKGDDLGQQYNTPALAIARGSDFIISGRGIYASADPVAAVKEYQKEGWQAYLRRIGKSL